jgi:hypothetical protein
MSSRTAAKCSESFAAFLFYEKFFSAAIWREIGMVGKMELAREMETGREM